MQQKKHQYERDPIQLSFIVHKFKKWSFTCSTVSSKDIKKSFAIHHSYNVWFYQLVHRFHVCLRALKRKYIWSELHFIVDEKVKILHFHDEDKSWWFSIWYHSVALMLTAIYIFWFWYSQNLSLSLFEL